MHISPGISPYHSITLFKNSFLSRISQPKKIIFIKDNFTHISPGISPYHPMTLFKKSFLSRMSQPKKIVFIAALAIAAVMICFLFIQRYFWQGSNKQKQPSFAGIDHQHTEDLEGSSLNLKNRNPKKSEADLDDLEIKCLETEPETDWEESENSSVKLFQNEDLAIMILSKAATSVLEVHNLKLVSTKWNQIVDKIFTQPKMSGLLARSIESIVSEEFFSDIHYYRNSGPAIYNIFLALRDYSKNEDLNARINARSGNGQGSRVQPDNIKQTFQNALDQRDHGGILQTMAAMSQASRIFQEGRPQRQKEKALVITLDQVIAFLQRMDLS